MEFQAGSPLFVRENVDFNWIFAVFAKFSLEIIKNGVILEEITLKDKEFFLIGRLQDLSDIVVQHPSISRKHAVLQYKNTGELFIYDLGAHFLNTSQ